VEKRLPKHVLTASEAERVLAAPAAGSALGLRDRAILEAFYSTGMRRMELIGLKLYDLDAERGPSSSARVRARRTG
jgi:integrase/recombinase XerD